jgi:hypothetical protein
VRLRQGTKGDRLIVQLGRVVLKALMQSVCHPGKHGRMLR